MYAPNKPFDLIELSPRLKVDLTDYVLNYDINKNLMATDFGLPVGGLVASTGGINLSNHDGVFTELNTFNTTAKTGSIIANNLKPQIKFDFYEAILDVNGYDKFITFRPNEAWSGIGTYLNFPALNILNDKVKSIFFHIIYFLLFQLIF